MNTDLKILHVNAEKNWAGGEVQNFLLMDYLHRQGYKVYLACRPGSVAEQKAKSLGYLVATFKMRNYLDFPAIIRMTVYLKKENFDIVHLHTSRAHVLAGTAAYLAKVPVVIVTRRMDYPLKKYFFTRFLYHTIVDKVVAISQGVKKAVLDAKIPEEQIELIPSGIPLEKFDICTDGTRIRKEFSIGNAPLVAVIASFHRRKGHAYFLDTMTCVLEQEPTAKFLLVGEGPLKKEIGQRVHSMGLDKSVIFTGKRTDIVNILAAIDVLAMPSLYEGLGVSIIEAMAMGVPVVGSDVGGIPELIHRETGFLVPPKDSKQMAEKILFLIQNKDKAREMGKMGRELVHEHYSAEKMAQANENLYHELIEKKSKRIDQGRQGR